MVKVYSRIIHFIFWKNTEVRKGCEIKKIKKRWLLKIFLVKGWSIEGCVTKVVEWNVMNVGLLILHKTKLLVL